MARPRVVMNSRGARAILRSAGMRRLVLDAAERAAERARQTAPVVSGEYRDGITVWTDETDRAVARVGSTAPHALIVEANTGNIVRALDAGA